MLLKDIQISDKFLNTAHGNQGLGSFLPEWFRRVDPLSVDMSARAASSPEVQPVFDTLRARAARYSLPQKVPLTH